MCGRIEHECVVCKKITNKTIEINLSEEKIIETVAGKQKIGAGCISFCKECLPEEFKQKKIPDNRYNPEDDKNE